MSRTHASKVRYCFAEDPRDDVSFLNVEWNGQAVESSGASANSKYFGMGLKSGGGGPFFVHRHDEFKRFGSRPASFHGHTGKVTCSAFHPFNDSLVVTGSLDCTVKLWQIPDGGLTETIKGSLQTMAGHSKRILFTEFHPTASNVLASASSTNQNEIKIWDITTGEAVLNLGDDIHGKLITDLKWNLDGSLLTTSCKDKKVRFVDPRTQEVVQKFKAHDSLRSSKLCWLDTETLLTTGFNTMGKREVRLWDPRNPSKELFKKRIDTGNAPLYPVFDAGTNLVLMTCKGSTTVKVWEYIPSEKAVVHCSDSSFKEQCRGFGMLPKRSLDINGVEVFRMVWIGGKKVQELKFKIPRKTRGFVKDFFPDDVAGIPAMDASAYFAGENKPPVKMCMDPSTFKADGGGATAAFTVAKSRAELEKELETALKEIKKAEEVKGDLLKQLKDAGIEPAKVDLNKLPPPPPTAAAAPKKAAPRAAKKVVKKKVVDSEEETEEEEEEEEKPKPKKKKKKKGPLISAKKKVVAKKEEPEPVPVPAPAPEEEEEEEESADAKRARLTDLITSKLGSMDVRRLSKILDGI